MRASIVLIVIAGFASACTPPAPASTAGPSADPSAPATETPQSTGTRVPTAPSTPASGLYLRAWYEQALPPDTTFSQLPILTISDGLAIDGNVAIPAIYPGPIFVTPFARSITAEGQRAIVDEARRLGLVGDTTDFTGGAVAPGSQMARLEMVVDGTTYDLSGPPDPPVGCAPGTCDAEPGSPEAFSAFWGGLSALDAWLGGELGAVEPYQPDRVAVLFVAPARPEPGLPQQPRTWPLAGAFDEMGAELAGAPGSRCVTISGNDLKAVLPVLEQANQLTVFLDDADGQATASAVVVVPGAESPCPD